MLFAFGLLFLLWCGLILLFLVMLIRPRWARMRNRKQGALIYGSSIVVGFIALLVLAGPATESHLENTNAPPAKLDVNLDPERRTITNLPEKSPSISPSIEPTPSVSPSIEVSPSPSPSPTPSPAATASPSPSLSESPSPTPSPSESIEPSPSESPSESPAPSPSESVEPSPSESPSVKPSPAKTEKPPRPSILLVGFRTLCSAASSLLFLTTVFALIQPKIFGLTRKRILLYMGLPWLIFDGFINQLSPGGQSLSPAFLFLYAAIAFAVALKRPELLRLEKEQALKTCGLSLLVCFVIFLGSTGEQTQSVPTVEQSPSPPVVRASPSPKFEAEKFEDEEKGVYGYTFNRKTSPEISLDKETETDIIDTTSINQALSTLDLPPIKQSVVKPKGKERVVRDIYEVTDYSLGTLRIHKDVCISESFLEEKRYPCLSSITIDTKPKEARNPSPAPIPTETPTPSPSPTQKPRRSEPIRDPVVGSCSCPYDTDRAGRRCGGRSAYSKPGGASPKCYTTD